MNKKKLPPGRFPRKVGWFKRMNPGFLLWGVVIIFLTGSAGIAFCADKQQVGLPMGQARNERLKADFPEKESLTLKTCIKEKAKIRKGPSMAYPVLYVLSAGAPLTVLDMHSPWFQVLLPNNTKGWIHKSLVLDGDRLERYFKIRMPQKPALPHKQPRKQGSISLNFRDMNIRDAFSSLAMEFKTNIVLSSDVKGNITLHIFKATLEEAIQSIALAGGFTAQNKNGSFYILKKVPETPERHMKTFRLNFVEIDQVKEILNALTGLAPIEVHTASKTIFVEDTPENIRRVEEVIGFLDSVPKQVMIEAEILEVALTDDMSFGVDWQHIWTDINVGTSGFSSAVLPDAKGISAIPSDGTGVFANLFAATGTNSTISLAIDALKEKTTVNTISTPKIIAIHGRSARVQVGGQQGYKVTTTNLGVQTETIEFIDTGVILEITPYIDKENNILLNVEPSINTAQIEEGIPVVKSTTVSTSLIARNGETVFIGGLIENADTKIRKSVPVLGDIPVLGNLFGRTVDTQQKTETVVMITPRILDHNEPFEPAPPLSKSGKILSKDIHPDTTPSTSITSPQ